MTTLAPFAHPPHALLCWIDDVNIYIEIPSTVGNPYVQKFPIVEGGLSKALNFLRVRYECLPTSEKNQFKPPEVKYRGQNKIVQTNEQRAETLALLRKLGLV